MLGELNAGRTSTHDVLVYPVSLCSLARDLNEPLDVLSSSSVLGNQAREEL